MKIIFTSSEKMPADPATIQQPLSLSDRCAFLKLPMEERRRILTEQAEEIAAHYQQNTEWRELQAGDIVEYQEPSE